MTDIYLTRTPLVNGRMNVDDMETTMNISNIAPFMMWFYHVVDEAEYKVMIYLPFLLLKRKSEALKYVSINILVSFICFEKDKHNSFRFIFSQIITLF